MNTFETNTANYIKSYNDKVKSKVRAELGQPVKKPQDDINNNLSMILILSAVLAFCYVVYAGVGLLEVAQLIK